LGHVLEIKQLAPNSNTVFGETFKPGVYYAQVIQGNRRTVLKLVKESSK